MAITTADIMGIVKAQLLLQDGTLDALINSYIPQIQQKILNYCNVETVPDGLKYVWSSMVIDVLKIKHAALPQIMAILGSTVEIKAGDTTSKITANKASIDSIVVSYANDLNRYRKLRW